MKELPTTAYEITFTIYDENDPYYEQSVDLGIVYSEHDAKSLIIGITNNLSPHKESYIKEHLNEWVDPDANLHHYNYDWQDTKSLLGLTCSIVADERRIVTNDDCLSFLTKKCKDAIDNFH